ncbi:MAG TPA: hypothetical protein VGG64_13100 [Pirellulales bacterium]|jgi:hypothetical protein
MANRKCLQRRIWRLIFREHRPFSIECALLASMILLMGISVAKTAGSFVEAQFAKVAAVLGS